jgi:hypothetical protein
MPAEPLVEFIPRDMESSDIKAILDHISSLIEEVVNYGSNVFRWSIDSIKGRDENVPALLMFRHIFELIDSISVLIKNSSVEPCNILLRSLFESYLNYEYLFEKDFKSRGMDFLVCYRHDEIKSLRRFDRRDEMHAQYEKLKARDKIAGYMPSRPVLDVAERIDNLKKIFELQSYKDSSAEYERIRTTDGKPPRHWYCMRGGPKDACQLADHLGFPAQYEILYRSWSELVHGTDIFKDKITIEGPELVSFSSLRMPTDAPLVALMAITFGLTAIRILTKHYVPEKIKENADWYKKEIMERYLNLNKIKIVGV